MGRSSRPLLYTTRSGAKSRTTSSSSFPVVAAVPSDIVRACAIECVTVRRVEREKERALPVSSARAALFVTHAALGEERAWHDKAGRVSHGRCHSSGQAEIWLGASYRMGVHTNCNSNRENFEAHYSYSKLTEEH
jgi:hypothetical protein